MEHAQRIAEPDTAPNGWPWSVLRGFKAGDVGALTDVYRLHVAEVTGQLRHGFSFSARGRHHRFVGYASAFELQDALHDTFRRAFEPRARQAYDGLRPYGPYLRTIARNVVLRGFRAREVQFPEVGGGDADGEAIEWADTESATPEENIAGQQIRAVVAGYLKDLPEDDQRLLRMRFVDGHSQRNVAETLGIGRQQIRGREAKLRKGLLAYLHTQGEAGLVPGASALALLVWISLLPFADSQSPAALGDWLGALHRLGAGT